jgi:hypothetical protein
MGRCIKNEISSNCYEQRLIKIPDLKDLGVIENF